MSNNPKDAGDDGAIAAIVFLIAIAAVPLVWAGVRNSVCPAPPNNESMWSLNCFEFWLNRYQTMIIGTAGIAAAIYAAKKAWRAVEMQISAAEDSERAKQQKIIREAKTIFIIGWRITEIIFQTCERLPDNEVTTEVISETIKKFRANNYSNMAKIVRKLIKSGDANTQITLARIAIHIEAQKNVLTEANRVLNILKKDPKHGQPFEISPKLENNISSLRRRAERLLKSI